MPRLCILAAAAFFALGTPASAQTLGANAVTVLKNLCGPFMAGTPFHDAAISGGFTYDASVQEYYFGSEERVATTPQNNSDECHIIAYFTVEEGPELFASIAAFAQTFQGQMTIDGAYDTDDQFQFWVSEWEGPTQSMSVTEMQYLDGTPLAAPLEGMVVALRRVY